ncbi:MAG: PQQ-binding-like beta-propeller repeat protein, partial [Planctomycetales bacterium]|nr:PQQ-binding-like beta-propeller repeat protein [Planctomycetales bacterium]
IYLTAAVPIEQGAEKDRDLTALCIDAARGKTLWSTTVFEQRGDAPGIHTKNSHASATPVAADDRLYVHFGHQGTACVNLQGDVLWRSQAVQYRPVHGNGGSPIVVGDLLVFSADGAGEQRVIALQRATGEIAWQTRRDVERPKKFAFSTPLAIEVEGRTQIVSPGAGMAGGYDAATGEEIWRVDYDGYSVVPRPIMHHGMVFLSSSFDAPSVLAIRPTGHGNVTESHVAWRLSRGAPHTPSLAAEGDLLYMVSDRGVATCVNADDGQVRWQERLGGSYSASPLLAHGKVYFQSEDGVGVVVAAGEKFEELARNELGERTLASLAVDGASLIIRGEKHLFRIAAPSAR